MKFYWCLIENFAVHKRVHQMQQDFRSTCQTDIRYLLEMFVAFSFRVSTKICRFGRCIGAVNIATQRAATYFVCRHLWLLCVFWTEHLKQAVREILQVLFVGSSKVKDANFSTNSSPCSGHLDKPSSLSAF